jgi:hypothetical protein
MPNRSDNFNRADGAIGTPSDGGSAWSVESGAWVVSSNRATVTSAGTIVLECSASDGTVSAKIYGAANSPAIVARYTNASNRILCGVDPWNAIALYRLESGSYNLLASSAPPVAGDTVSLVLLGSSVKVLHNGAEVISVTESFNSTATKHGLSLSGDSAQFDDFAFTCTVDTDPPTAGTWASNTAGTAITANLSESGCVPSSGSGGFSLGGTSATVASWAISGTTLTLTLSGVLMAGETVTVSYDRANTTDDIADAATNYLANITSASVTNNKYATLTAGTASFVTSGPAGISVEATASSNGDGAGPTYQWERNADGGSYADLSGKTSLSCTDSTATTAGVVYRYRCKQTRGTDTVTTNAVVAQVYEGGAIGSGGVSRARLVNAGGL